MSCLRNKNSNALSVGFLLLMAGLAACHNDEVVNTNKGYVVVMRTEGTEEETEDYVMLMDELGSEEISPAKESILQPGWCYYASTGSSYLSFQYETGDVAVYDIKDKSLKEKGTLPFQRADCFGAADATTLAMAGAPWGGPGKEITLQLIDVAGVKVKKSVTTPLYEMAGDDDVNKWPTSIVVRGDKLFISFYPVVGPTWETPLTDTAYVSVYTYPALDYVTTLKDSRTSPIGYYGASPAMLKTENGDIYTLSSSSFAAGFTQTTKPSGILRIKNGQTVFDADYFFDVEEVSGYKVLTAGYAGKGKAVARVVADDDISNLSMAFEVTEPICKLVVIDLIKKTVDDVQMINNGVAEGAVLHGGQYATPFFVENGKVFVSVNNGTEAYLYEVNPATAEAVRGPKILGNEIQAIYKAM